MFFVNPTIELVGNKCKFVIQGEEESEDYYQQLAENPHDLCKLFRLENVKSILINDVDSFSIGSNSNLDFIAYITESTFLPFLILSNFQTIEDCRSLLEFDVHTLILADIAYRQPNETLELIKDYSDRRIAFYLPIRDGQVCFEHIRKSFPLKYYLSHIQKLGAKRLFVKSDIKLNSDDPRAEQICISLKNSVEKWNYITDVGNYDELIELSMLKNYNMDSVSLGDSFYGTVFPCQKIWRIAEFQNLPNQS